MNSHGGLMTAEKTVADGICPRGGTDAFSGQLPVEKLASGMDGFMEMGAVCRAGRQRFRMMRFSSERQCSMDLWSVE